jgi:hypothetical protein
MFKPFFVGLDFKEVGSDLTKINVLNKNLKLNNQRV